jgi:succinate dehydrogenase/fumarate reductase flavoprotein subunit
MDVLACDVLVVGGGGAGLRAAIAVAETDPRLRVGLVSKVYPMRSHTVAAEGGAAGVIKPGDSLDAHAYDTISGADWLADQTRSSCSWPRHPASCCGWSTGAARGAASPTARSPCAPSAA